MAWEFVSVGTLNNQSSGNVTPGQPSGIQAGDLLVAVISYRDSATFSLPSGWTLVDQQSSGNTSTGTAAIASGLMAWTIYNGSSLDRTFTRTGGSVCSAYIIAYRNTGGDIVFDAGRGETMSSASTSVSVGGITTTRSDALIVFGACGAVNSGFTTFDAATDPSTDSGTGSNDTSAPTAGQWRERADSGNGTSPQCRVAIADAIKSSAGSTGDLTVTAGASARHVVVVGAFALDSGTQKPASAALAAAATLAASAARVRSASAALSASASLAVSANAARAAASALAIAATATAAAGRARVASAALAASATLTSIAARTKTAVATLAATVAVAATASAAKVASATLSITVTLTHGKRTSALLAGSVSVSAIAVAVRSVGALLGIALRFKKCKASRIRLEMLAAVKASLVNPEHDWRMMAVASHSQIETSTVSSIDPNTQLPVTTTVQNLHESITYQLESKHFQTALIFIVQKLNGALEEIQMTFLGTTFEVMDAELANILNDKAALVRNELEGVLLEMIE